MNSTASTRFLEQITNITRMERGKLTVICETAKGYSYKLQTWEEGKNVSRYIAPDQAEATKQALDGYHKFQELTQRYAKAIIDQTRAELTATSKKKKSHGLRVFCFIIIHYWNRDSLCQLTRWKNHLDR